MSHVRPPAAIAVIAAVVLGLGSPVAAREDHAPPTAPPSTTTTTTSTTIPGIDVGQGGDVSGARPPGADVQVDPVDPEPANQVLQISAGGVEAERAAVQAMLDEVDARIDRLRSDLRTYGELTDDLVDQQRQVARRAVEARIRMRQRAVGAYVNGNRPEVDVAYGSTNPSEAEERSTLVQTVLEADRSASHRLLARRMEVTSLLSRVLEQTAQTEAELGRARDEAGELRIRLQSAEVALRVYQAGGDLVITGFVFPVADPHTFSSTYGAPRSGGRSHQGNDIFAPMGTPLLAVERGVLTRIGEDDLGGTKLWLVGESGTQYYYAHLSAYVDGIHEGMAVEAGEIVGYVGNTGNAISTPPHCHFEIHPDGGDAIDPYPLLHAVDQVDGEHVLPPRQA